jgi:hypothetical protein
MDNIYIIAIILAVIGGGIFVIPYAKNKGWINKDKTESVRDALYISRLLMDVVNIEGLDKTKATFALGIVDTVVEYVDTFTDENVDNKIASLDVIEKLLKEFGVSPTASERLLIEIAIEEAIKKSHN